MVLKPGVLDLKSADISKSTKENRSTFNNKIQKLLNNSRDNGKGLKLGFDNQKISSVFAYALEGFVVKNLTEKEVESLRTDPRILSIEQDYLIALAKPKPPVVTQPSQTVPWGITRIGGAGNGAGKTAWVVDSGIDLDHPDLNVDVARSKSFTGDNNPDDTNGHGTHVAGIIGALDNSIGVVGVAAGAKVVSLKVLAADGKGDFSWTVSALDYIYANGSVGDVVNMSLGPDEPFRHTATDLATEQVASKGIKIAIAAGNSYDNADLYTPAAVNHPNIYTISAVAPGDFWTTFSNYGSSVDYAAPGYDILSTYLKGGYTTMSGTSMASPHAAGVLLLGESKSDGFAKSAYWEYVKKGGGTLTGKYSATNSYSLSIFREDKDNSLDPIIHR